MSESRYETELYVELCCEMCCEPIHTHFDCPACKTHYAGTSKYGALEPLDVFTCQSCNAEFELVKIVDFDIATIRRTKPKK